MVISRRLLVSTALVASLAAAIVACGGAKPAPTMAARPQSMPSEAGAGAPAEAAPTEFPASDPRGELEKRVAQLEADREQLGLAAPAPIASPGPATPMAEVPQSTDATCKPAKTERCTSSCTLSDSICKNAGRICELAADMPGDDWAAGKCATAKETCTAAHERCCTCQ